MPVPRHAAIQRGTLVSIVLKQDQRTGRQVQGSVSDILTRADHPRGVKVRLSDGRVGRVQAIMSHNQQQQQQQSPYAQGAGYDQHPQYSGVVSSSSDSYSQQPPRNTPQYDQRAPNTPQRPSGSVRTLDDFIPESERGEQVEYMENYENSRAQTKDELDRESLQKQFPNVDGSLIAAIYGDCGGDLSGCREMLQALSED